MSELIENIWNGILQTSVLEGFAVITGIIYVILAAKSKISCWIFALMSSAAYVYLCFFANLYLETILQLFYFVMGIIGWILWNRPKEEVTVRTWGIKWNILNIFLSGIATLALGYFFKTHTAQAYPYLDAFIFSFCLSATFMITKKVHEGWIYLIIIDVFSIYLYAGRDLYLSAVLYLIFTVIAVFGWIEWWRIFRGRSIAV